MPGRQGNEISALPFSAPFFTAAFQKLMVWLIEPRRRRKMFYCYRWKHFVLVSEAPTLLCGLRASQILKSLLLLQYIRGLLYDFSWGVGGVYSDKSSCCSSDSNSYIEEGSESASHLRLNCKNKQTKKISHLLLSVIHVTCLRPTRPCLQCSWPRKWRFQIIFTLSSLYIFSFLIVDW